MRTFKRCNVCTGTFNAGIVEQGKCEACRARAGELAPKPRLTKENVVRNWHTFEDGWHLVEPAPTSRRESADWVHHKDFDTVCDERDELLAILRDLWESAHDGRRIPEWLEERLLPIRQAVKR